MALVTATYSCFAGKTFPVVERTNDKRGEGVFLLVDDRKLWFGIDVVNVL